MPYAVGEEVAIAQPYKNDDVLTYNAYNEDGTAREDGFQRHKEMLGSNGYRNKMFVKAEYMPHRIRITGIKVERLQDVREEDAMREGVFKYDKPPLHHEADMFAPWAPYVRPYKWDSDNLIYRCTARYAFAYLIDKISGGGTWNRNPWVFAYEFELLKQRNYGRKETNRVQGSEEEPVRTQMDIGAQGAHQVPREVQVQQVGHDVREGLLLLHMQPSHKSD